jgi:outer membrane protein
MKKFIVLLAVAGLVSTASFAQKFAHINSRELLSVMPEMTKADADLKKAAQEFDTQVETMVKQLEKQGQDFQASEKTMSDAIRELKVKEIQDFQARIQGFQQKAEEQLGKKKEDLYKPILEKADKAIKDVAREKGVDYVFDTSMGTLLFVKDSDSILAAVKAKLGIK